MQMEYNNARTGLEGIDHVALAVRDVARSAEWYQEVLELARLHEEVWGDYPAVVGLGTTAIALFPVEGDDPLPAPGRDTLAMRHVAFRADQAGFKAAQARLKERGIVFEFQDHEIAHSIYFRDPDGHMIEITTYELS
jgi:catechol 2,3-dioxygenase-like lactoylglutathione lyase family enzyme